MKIEVERANEPLDINWRNMADGGSRGLYICRRLFLNLAAVLILLFLSTPTVRPLSRPQVIFSTIGKLLSRHSNVTEWLNELPYIAFLQDFLGPLLIIGLNLFLLLLIGYSANLERHSTYSAYHYSVFNKSLLYLALNMLVIPALTLATAGRGCLDS